MYCVKNGIDRIECVDKYLKGKRVALLTNASGVNKCGKPTYDILAEKYNLAVMFAPEHGIRTNLQDGKWNSESLTDEETGAIIYPLKSKGNDFIPDVLKTVDIVTYDIADVGARFYTYIYNLTALMCECAKAHVPVLIFDRINPISGSIIQGSSLDEEKYSSFIGEYSVPTRYGLTVAEYASYINEVKNINCELLFVPCDGWQRDMYADETDLLFVNPSPNITGVDCAINYIGTCIFEATNISEGRGTTRPFDLVGAPFVNSYKMLEYMRAQKLEGVVFRRAYFTPQFSKHSGELCEGLQLHIVNRQNYNPILTMFHLYKHLSAYSEFIAKPQSLCLRYGDDTLCGEFSIDTEMQKNEIYCAKFENEAKKYKIYY